MKWMKHAYVRPKGVWLSTFLLLLFNGWFVTRTNAQSQNGTLKGIVTNEGGAYLSEVTVVARSGDGKLVGRLSTDSLGLFEFNHLIVDSAYTLDFSLVGYKPVVMKNVLVKAGGASLLVQLAPNVATGLNEVVVVGYGQQRKITLTGAQSTVNARDIEQPVANLSTLLAGRVSGVVGVQRSGLPGSNAADIWIRGISTFGSSSSSPLVIVDGVKGRNIDDINAEDIASFSILKDATSTAVYGAEGANGVIIVTTKRGHAGKMNLMGNFQQGFTAFTKLPKMADAGTFMNLRNEAMTASGLQAAYSQAYIDSTLSPTADHYVYPNVDWMKLLFNKLSDNRRVQFSATGGSETTQYYASVSYYDESSLIKTDGLQNYDASTRYKKYNFVSNVDMALSKTTKFRLGVQGYISSFNQPGKEATIAFADAMNTSPVYYPASYPGNKVAGVAEGANPSPNPWAETTQSGYLNDFTSKVSSTVSLDQGLGFILKGLSANAQYSFDTYSYNRLQQTRQRSVYYLNQATPYNTDGSLNLDQVISGTDALTYSHSTDQSREFSVQGQVVYNRSFGFHNIYAMGVYNQWSQPNPTATSYTSSIPTRTQNYATRVTYSYQDKYLAEFDGGYTGSQVFSPENRYGFFPSFSAGWVMSKEKFWAPLANTVSFFKLRYSNGFSGAIGGTRFDYLTTITTAATGISFGTPSANTSITGLNISHYGANVKWAKSHDQDLGIEFNVLHDKLTFVLDWFEKYRTGVFLTRANFPGYAGLQYNPDGNYGTTINKGFDGTVELNPIQLGRKLSLSVRGTFTYNKDKLLENGAAPYEQPYLDPRGRNINAEQGYVADGLFQNQKEIDNHADQSGVGGAPRIGDIRYKDLNGDGIVNSYDKTTISRGDVAPLTFGLGFNVHYDQFYFSAFFEGSEGARRILSGIARSPFSAGNGLDNNLFANATDRWTEENHAENPFYPRLGVGTSANANNNVASTWWVKDISFIRFKTLDVGYYLPTKFVSRAGFKNARIYFSGINLMYWSPFKLWDPEMNTGEGDTYPNTKTFSFGLQVNL